MLKTIHAKIQESYFKNVYWFSRYLLNTDQFGALGKSKETEFLNLVAILETLLTQENFSAGERLQLFKNTLSNEIKKFCKVGTKNYNLSLNLISKLDEEIQTVEDAFVFCISVKYFVAPINQAMKFVPADDKIFCETAAKNILDTFGEEKIANLIETWDNLGVKGCLDVERSLVVEEFTNLTGNLSRLKIFHSELDDNIMLTAFVQEFERRLGQKRKSRGGQRDVASYWHITNAATNFRLSLPQARQLFVNFSKVARALALKNYVRPLNNFVGDIKKTY